MLKWDRIHKVPERELRNASESELHFTLDTQLTARYT